MEKWQKCEFKKKSCVKCKESTRDTRYKSKPPILDYPESRMVVLHVKASEVRTQRILRKLVRILT